MFAVRIDHQRIAGVNGHGRFSLPQGQLQGMQMGPVAVRSHLYTGRRQRREVHAEQICAVIQLLGYLVGTVRSFKNPNGRRCYPVRNLPAQGGGFVKQRGQGIQLGFGCLRLALGQGQDIPQQHGLNLPQGKPHAGIEQADFQRLRRVAILAVPLADKVQQFPVGPGQGCRVDAQRFRCRAAVVQRVVPAHCHGNHRQLPLAVHHFLRDVGVGRSKKGFRFLAGHRHIVAFFHDGPGKGAHGHTENINLGGARGNRRAEHIRRGAGGRQHGDKLIRQLNVGILLLKGKGIHIPAIQVQAQGCNLHGLGGVNDRGFMILQKQHLTGGQQRRFIGIAADAVHGPGGASAFRGVEGAAAHVQETSLRRIVAHDLRVLRQHQPGIRLIEGTEGVACRGVYPVAPDVVRVSCAVQHFALAQ